jgi:pimeloyl-ACP methyl ester carboxylesterase
MELNHFRGGSGEPLLLIHGIGSQWQVWEPVLGLLTPHRDVIAIDLPGFGATPRPLAGIPAGPNSLVSLVGEYLDEIGVARPHVAGNSLGGLISLELAKRKLVRSATVLSPAGFANRRETFAARAQLRIAVRGARLAAPRADALLRSKFGRTLAFNLLVAHPTHISPAQAADATRALADAPWFDSTLPTVGPRAFESNGRTDVPVTIAWGERDRVLPPRQADRAARMLPAARMVTLYGCGHVPTYDDPEQVAQILLEGSSV